MSENIIILGAAGRMGTTIALLAEEEGLGVAGMVEQAAYVAKLSQWKCLVDSDVRTVLAASPAAVVIDFTAPQTSLETARIAREIGNPVVIGTTGFTEDQKMILQSLAKETPLFWSPNMSIAVNVLMDILPRLSRMLGADYDLEMMEIHHNKKKDSPSGTALRLAESMAEGRDWNLPDVACCTREGIIGERPKKEIGIQALRGGDVAGVHTAYFIGQGERIEVTHHAHSRENFARGALRAAKWMHARKAGALYSMQDVLRSAESDKQL